MAIQTYRANNVKAAYASKLSDPNEVSGGRNWCTIQGSNDWWYRTFLQYDVSEIPLGSTVVSAKMYIYCNSQNDNGSQGTTNIARITTEWDEATLCWNMQPEFEGRYLSESVHAPAVNSWGIWDITRLVQGWCNGSYPNYGLYVSNDNEGAYRVNWDTYNYHYDLDNSNDGDDSNNLGTYLLIEYDPDTFSEPFKPPYEEVIDFSKEDWKTQREEVFTVTDGATPFFVNSTFTYNGLPTLRSGSIGHSGTSETTITVIYEEPGSLEFKYTVDSESRYDWLRVYIDGAEKVAASGSYSWTTYIMDMSAGTHTITFKYTKDGSASTGHDAGAIGYIKFIGVKEPYDRKYLVRSNSVLYTLAQNELSVIDTDELTADVFLEYGLDFIPDVLPAYLLTLENPEVLFWQDSDKPLPSLSATLYATPPTQTITTDLIDMSDVTIKGIESVSVDCDGSPLIAVSFDGKNTWKAYDGTDWVTLTSDVLGMAKETIESIPVEQWAAIRGDVVEMYIRVVLSTTDQVVRQIYVAFIN